MANCMHFDRIFQASRGFGNSRRSTLAVVCVGLLSVIVLCCLALHGLRYLPSRSGKLAIDSHWIAHDSVVAFDRYSQQALDSAEQQNKACLIFFTTDRCPFCRQMKLSAFVDAKVGALANEFVCVLVDADKQPEACQEFGIDGYPTIQFVAANGQPLTRLVGQQSTEQVLAGMQTALSRLAWLDNTVRR